MLIPCAHYRRLLFIFSDFHIFQKEIHIYLHRVSTVYRDKYTAHHHTYTNILDM